MAAKLDAALFRKTRGEDDWFLPESEVGCEIHVADRDGRPDEASIALARAVVDGLDRLQKVSLVYLRRHYAFPPDDYWFSDIVTILREADRHGVRVLLDFHNDIDGYLAIEVGFRESEIQERGCRVHTALVMYH